MYAIWMKMQWYGLQRSLANVERRLVYTSDQAVPVNGQKSKVRSGLHKNNEKLTQVSFSRRFLSVQTSAVFNFRFW